MNKHFHAVAWIDHHEARVVYFNADDTDETVVHAPHQNHHIHAKAGSRSGTHLVGDATFFREIADVLAPAHEIYIVGPAAAKNEFMSFLRQQGTNVLPKVTGVETMDKMSDGELVASARRFFIAADRMRVQIQRP